MDYVESFDWLHLTSFACKKTEKSFRTQLTVAKKFSGEISLDPGNIYAGFGLKKILPLIKNSSIVLPSKDEIEILTGLPYKDACNLLISEGVKIVAVKYGGRGCYITDGKMKVSIPAFRTQVVDTTGAGDAFCAGFLYGIAKGKSLKECGRIANKVASFCISGPGARFLPRLSDL
jgi:ribokinase